MIVVKNLEKHTHKNSISGLQQSNRMGESSSGSSSSSDSSHSSSSDSSVDSRSESGLEWCDEESALYGARILAKSPEDVK